MEPQGLQKTYVCLGSCQSVVSEEQYESGMTTCNNASCSMKGEPLVRGKKSETTGQNEKVEDQKELTPTAV